MSPLHDALTDQGPTEKRADLPNIPNMLKGKEEQLAIHRKKRVSVAGRKVQGMSTGCVMGLASSQRVGEVPDLCHPRATLRKEMIKIYVLQSMKTAEYCGSFQMLQGPD